MAIGIFAAATILFGWNIEGPIRVASASRTGVRSVAYRESLATRLALTVLVLPAAATVVAVVSRPENRLDAIVIALATSLGGLSPAWYCIGIGKPRLLAAVDTLPRVIAAGLAIPALLVWHQIWVYGLLLGLSSLASVMVFPRAAGIDLPETRLSLREIWSITRRLSPVAVGGLAGNAYGSTPVPIATASVSAASASSFASADQIYRYALFPVIVLGNALQGWTLEARGSVGQRRQLIGLALHFILGICGAAFLAVLGPWLTGLLFGSAVSATWAASAYFGLSFFFICIASPLQRNLLIPARRAKLVLTSTVIAAIAGLAIMLLAGAANNADAIAMGLAVSEGLMVLILIVPATAVFRNHSYQRTDA
jgi:PST family polysaccharide transporter